MKNPPLVQRPLQTLHPSLCLALESRTMTMVHLMPNQRRHPMPLLCLASAVKKNPPRPLRLRLHLRLRLRQSDVLSSP